MQVMMSLIIIERTRRILSHYPISPLQMPPVTLVTAIMHHHLTKAPRNWEGAAERAIASQQMHNPPQMLCWVSRCAICYQCDAVSSQVDPVEHTASLTDPKGFCRFFAPRPLQSVQGHYRKDLNLIRLIRVIHSKGVHSSQVMLRITRAMPGLCQKCDQY